MTRRMVVGSQSEYERLLDSYNHTRQWNAERWERLSHWARSELNEQKKREFFSILANGVRDSHENPTGAQMINTLKHALKEIREKCEDKWIADRIDLLRKQGWL